MNNGIQIDIHELLYTCVPRYETDYPGYMLIVHLD